jgi:thiol-disulfide isomerase/thioredoxin
MKISFIVSALLLALSVSAQEEPRLEVGDALPPLAVEAWVQGEPFATFEPGEVYVVDLWAVWCTPCLASMPYLSRLQERYAGEGVVVVGVTNEDKWGNTLEKARAFVAERDSMLRYRVAWLAPSKDTSGLQGIFNHPWMQALGTQSLPQAFVVDRQGRLAYVGDPHTVDEVVAELVSGEYDVDKALERFRRAREGATVYDGFKTALEGKDWPAAQRQAAQLVAEYGEFVEPKLLTGLADQVAKAGADAPRELLDLALRAAQLAILRTDFESPGHFDALASVYFALGDVMAAVLAERTAISLSEGGMRQAQQKKLGEYMRVLRESRESGER